MAEQAKQDDGSLEQAQAAWTNFLRLNRVIVALAALTLIALAFVTL